MDPAVTYGSYLHVDELLDLQQPRSDGPEHDELLFIVIHQVYELWFKEILHEIDRVKRLLEADEAHRAQHTLKRILTILKVLVAQLDILETMTPLEFLSFRARLEAASGFQSDQFRQLEFALGRKSTAAIERFAAGSRARARRSSGAFTSRRCGTRFCVTSRARAMQCRTRRSQRDVTAADRAVGGDSADPVEHLSHRPEELRSLRAAGRSRRRRAGVALSPRQDGGADDRREDRHRRIGRRGVSRSRPSARRCFRTSGRSGRGCETAESGLEPEVEF